MQSILVLTDFSDAAFHAARYAGMLATVLKSERLILFHAFQTMPAVSNEPMVFAGREKLKEDSQRLMETWQESIKQFIPAFTEVSALVDEIDLVKGINALCEEKQVDLVVMGITGKTNLERILIGSTTIRVMKVIHFPLLIIPKDAPDNRPQRVLLATDLREVEEKLSVPVLTKLLDNLKAELLVVNVADKEPAASKLNTEITALHTLLDRYQPAFHYINNPETAEAINLFAVDKQAGMIITLHEQQAGLEALFHESVSKKLAWHSQIPLLVIPL